MKILTLMAHTGYDYEFAKTGHEFYCLDPEKKGWDEIVRPKPENWHFIEKIDPAVKYDLAITASYTGYELFKSVNCPMIFNQIADGSWRKMPACVEDRCEAVCFLSDEVAERWELKEPTKKMMIPLGVDHERFFGWDGEWYRALTVGIEIPTRWEKGFTQLRDVQKLTKVDVIGRDNEGLAPESLLGSLDAVSLALRYRKSRVYFNPGCVIGISVAEAMMTGMPIVTFPPINLKSLLSNQAECFVVETVDEAAYRIDQLNHDFGLSCVMGKKARMRAMEHFNLKRFISEWNLLFYSITGLEIPL